MDEAARGRENRDSYCRKRSTETESECKRENKNKKMEEMVEKYAMLFHGGGSAPMVPLSVQHTYDQKMKNLNWHFSIIENLVVQLQYVYRSAVSHGLSRFQTSPRKSLGHAFTPNPRNNFFPACS